MAINLFAVFGDPRPLLLGARVYKPKMAVKIVGGSDVYLSSCSSIMKYTRIMTLAPFERLNVTNSGNYSLWDDTLTILELWASEVWHYLEILLN